MSAKEGSEVEDKPKAATAPGVSAVFNTPLSRLVGQHVSLYVILSPTKPWMGRIEAIVGGPIPHILFVDDDGENIVFPHAILLIAPPKDEEAEEEGENT